MIGSSGRKKTCKQCGFTAPEEWFGEYSRVNPQTRMRIYYRRATCPGCIREARDKRRHQKRVLREAEQILWGAKQ